jgi:hypothetical protein
MRHNVPGGLGDDTASAGVPTGTPAEIAAGQQLRNWRRVIVSPEPVGSL